MIGSHRIGGDRHPLQHPMGIALQHGAVHEGAGIAFIGVADHHLAGPGHAGHGGPFQTGGIAGAAAAAQAAALQFRQHPLRTPALQHPLQLAVGPHGDRLVQVGGIDQPAVLQHDPLLPLEEGMGEIQPFAPGGGPLQRRRLVRALMQPPGQSGHQGFGVLRVHTGIEIAIRIEGQQGALAAGAQAAHRAQLDPIAQFAPGDGRFEGPHQGAGAPGQAAGRGAAAQAVHGASPLRRWRRPSGVSWRPTVPSISTRGASLQVPRQRTSERLTQPSARRSPI
jgi:hypothetical protein